MYRSSSLSMLLSIHFSLFYQDFEVNDDSLTETESSSVDARIGSTTTQTPEQTVSHTPSPKDPPTFKQTLQKKFSPKSFGVRRKPGRPIGSSNQLKKVGLYLSMRNWLWVKHINELYFFICIFQMSTAILIIVEISLEHFTQQKLKGKRDHYNQVWPQSEEISTVIGRRHGIRLPQETTKA